MTIRKAPIKDIAKIPSTVLNAVDCLTDSDSFVVVFEGEVVFGGLLIVITKYSNAFRSRSPQMSGDLLY